MSHSNQITPIVNIEIEESTDYNLRINYTEPSTGLPVDLTNYEAELYVDENMGDAGAVFLFNTTPGGGITLSGAGGEVLITIVSSATSGLGMFRGTYSLYLVSPTLIKTKISKGFFTVISSTLGAAGGPGPGVPNPTSFNLSGVITSVGYVTSTGAQTGNGDVFVMQDSPTLTTPDLGTPTAMEGTNLTGTGLGFTAGNVVTNANLTGDVTSIGNETTISDSVVTGKALTGLTVAAGTVEETDSILTAIGKLAAGSGGAENLNDLFDVDITSVQQNNVLMFYDGGWSNQPLTINSLENFNNIANLSANDVLYYNGVYWDNRRLILNYCGDVNISLNPSLGDVLTYDGLQWTNSASSGGVSELGELTDIVITTPTDGQILIYDETNSVWINVDSGIVDQLGLLGDVHFGTTPITGEVLTYDGLQWINSASSGGVSEIGELTDIEITAAIDGETLVYNSGTNTWVNGTVTTVLDLDDLDDVVITGTPGTGEVLTYDGANWVNDTVSLSADLNDLGDTVITTPVSSEVLTYNGTNWINDTLPAGLSTGGATSEYVIDPDWNKTVLLMHFDGTNNTSVFTDSSQYNRTFSLNGTPLTKTDEFAVGTSSVYINSNNIYLGGPELDFDYGSGQPFTIEFWMMAPSLPGSFWRMIMLGSNGDNDSLQCSLIPDGSLYFAQAVGSPTAYISTVANTIIAGQWHHLAMVWTNATSYKLYVDGRVKGTGTGVAWPSGAKYISIGRDNGGAGGGTGYLDELRITKGIARYTSEFIPTTIPFSQNLPSSSGSVQFNLNGGLGGTDYFTFDHAKNYFGIGVRQPTERVHVGYGNIKIEGTIGEHGCIFPDGTKQLTASNTSSRTGTTSTFVMQNSPTLVTPNLGTPSTLVGTNITGTGASFTAGTVTTNANLTGDVTSTGNATSIAASVVTGKLLTGLSLTRGAVAATDSILAAIGKLHANYYTPPATAASFQVGGTTTIAYVRDTVYYATATGATSWAITGLPGSGNAAYWTIELTNGAAGVQVWFTGVTWDGGIPPTPSAGIDVYTFYTRDGGTTIRGFLAAANMS